MFTSSHPDPPRLRCGSKVVVLATNMITSRLIGQLRSALARPALGVRMPFVIGPQPVVEGCSRKRGVNTLKTPIQIPEAGDPGTVLLHVVRNKKVLSPTSHIASAACCCISVA